MSIKKNSLEESLTMVAKKRTLKILMNSLQQNVSVMTVVWFIQRRNMKHLYCASMFNNSQIFRFKYFPVRTESWITETIR